MNKTANGTITAQHPTKPVSLQAYEYCGAPIIKIVAQGEKIDLFGCGPKTGNPLGPVSDEAAKTLPKGADRTAYRQIRNLVLSPETVTWVEATLPTVVEAIKADIAERKRATEIAAMGPGTFWTLEHAAQYGISIQRARRFTESELGGYSEWYRPLAMCGMGEGATQLEHIGWRDIADLTAGRKADGQFNGCENQVWTISDEERDRILALNTARGQAKASASYATENALKATAVPASALAAYRRYRGDEEKAWESEDESAWAAIRHYRDAIEAQGLAYPSMAVIKRELASDDMTPVDGDA